MNVEFKFSPKQKVKILAYGLDCNGRIQRCYVNCSGHIFYDVEYALDGDIKGRDFFEDDLEAL